MARNDIKNSSLLKTKFLIYAFNGRTLFCPFRPCTSWFQKVLFIPFAVDFYAFRLAFSTISPCIQHQNALHLASKRKAFSTKTHCVLHHIALHFAAKRTAFRYKSQKKWVFVAVSLNKNSFRLHVQPPPFCTKTNPRENRFFAARLAIGGKKCTHSVKILAEKLTKFGRLTSRQVNKLTRE